LKGDHHNKVERMNGEFRDREKVIRGAKKADSPILEGYQIYHNYIRPHLGINGKTLAEAAGITIEGENKWQTVIENAKNERKETLASGFPQTPVLAVRLLGEPVRRGCELRSGAP